MGNYGWVSILPPLIAIILAIKTKQVFISLTIGIWIGWTIINNYNPIQGLGSSIQSFVDVFKDADNTRIILFSTMVGGLIALTQRSGGINGLIDFLLRRGWIKSRRGALLLAWMLGIIIFIESTIKILIVGTISRPLFDRLKISREKLAYIADSTSAPICMLIPLNAWGAFVIGLLSAQGLSNSTAVLVKSIPLNLYSLIAVSMVLFLIITGKDIGPMKESEYRVLKEAKLLRDGASPLLEQSIIEMKPVKSDRYLARNMVVPIALMSLAMPTFLLITGGGNIIQGSGSTAVLWSVTVATVSAGLMYKFQKLMSVKEIVDTFIKGCGGIISLPILMILAFSLGSTSKELGTGAYIASVTSSFLYPWIVPSIVFLSSAFIAFSTGTSFGTFALMIPLAIPLATELNVCIPLTVSAVLGGGVFGDHCSPVSDTTIVASMASACDHIDHVNTQLPYALISAGLSFLIYLILSVAF